MTLTNRYYRKLSICGECPSLLLLIFIIIEKRKKSKCFSEQKIIFYKIRSAFFVLKLSFPFSDKSCIPLFFRNKQKLLPVCLLPAVEQEMVWIKEKSVLFLFRQHCYLRKKPLHCRINPAPDLVSLFIASRKPFLRRNNCFDAG